MNTFDRICAAVAFVMGAVFMLLGVIGLFTGCRAHFALPPILGVAPAFIGWGIVRAVMVAWRTPSNGEQAPDRNDEEHFRDAV